MKAIERLKRDHAILRSKLDVLEAGLRMGLDTWYVLREVCFTLARQVRNHMQREEDLVMACRKAMKPHMLAEMAVEHRDEPEHLRAINRLFVEAHGHTLERIRPTLTEVIQGLRRHMTEEERELFPILERELIVREPAKAQTQQMAETPLRECMTVNGVLHLYPSAKGVFERLFVNIPYEGCDCLDEVAWRRGMDVQELLEELAQASSSSTSAIKGVEKAHELCECR
jgi:iron-sulfur cluster repair protein YtfE (RIC family)